MKTSIFLTLLCIYFESGHSIGYYAKLSKRSSHLASVNNEESGEFPWNKVRLPQSVNPLEYGIFLHHNLTEKKFSGKVDIKCEVLKSTKFVVLHSKNLNISKARVTTLPSNDVNEAHIRMKNDTDQLFLMLDESINSQRYRNFNHYCLPWYTGSHGRKGILSIRILRKQ